MKSTVSKRIINSNFDNSLAATTTNAISTNAASKPVKASDVFCFMDMRSPESMYF